MAEQMKQSQLKQQLAMAALTQAQKQQLQALKTEAEKTKKKKTFVTGLSKDRDRLIAALLGLYKDAPTGPRGNPMGEGGLETTRVIDFAKLYELYPPGSELQFSFDLSEFLGKKGSTVTYAGKDNKAEGGIVERQEGSPPSGETSSNILSTDAIDFGIIDLPQIVGTGERDDIVKILLGTDAALQELMEMKQYIVDDPALAGFPGLILEKARGVFTMFDQLDNAYLGDRLISDKSGIYKFFDRPEVTKINKLKKRISKALADLASFKGSRQPTEGQQEETQQETDPAGGFGATVSLEKIDGVGEEMVLLVKELLRALGGPTQDATRTTESDLEYITTQFTKLDNYLENLLNLSPSAETTGFTQKKSFSLDDIESVLGN